MPELVNVMNVKQELRRLYSRGYDSMMGGTGGIESENRSLLLEAFLELSF